MLLRGSKMDEGIQAWWEAAKLVEQVRPVQARDRLRPLAEQAATALSSDATDLAHHLQALCATGVP